MNYLFKNFENISLENNFEVEILSEKSEAFIPDEIRIRAFDSYENLIYLDINYISIMGYPQLVNYDGIEIKENRGNTIFFQDFSKVNFSAFGSSKDQGLKIFFDTKSENVKNIEIIIIGKETKAEDIQRSYNSNNYHILFRKDFIEPKKKKVIELLASRAGGFKIKTLEIQTLDEDVTLCSAMNNGTVQFENVLDININSNFFEKEREVNFKRILSIPKKGLILTFENPTDKCVDVYIKARGYAVDASSKE